MANTSSLSTTLNPVEFESKIGKIVGGNGLKLLSKSTKSLNKNKFYNDDDYKMDNNDDDDYCGDDILTSHYYHNNKMLKEDRKNRKLR
jgi:hypothetical protein